MTEIPDGDGALRVQTNEDVPGTCREMVDEEIGLEATVWIAVEWPRAEDR